MGLGELRERIALCEDSLRFNKEKHSALMSKKVGGFDPDSRVIYQPRYQQPLYALALIRCLFSAMRNFLFENYSLLAQQQQLLKQLLPPWSGNPCSYMSVRGTTRSSDFCWKPRILKFLSRTSLPTLEYLKHIFD